MEYYFIFCILLGIFLRSVFVYTKELLLDVSAGDDKKHSSNDEKKFLEIKKLIYHVELKVLSLKYASFVCDFFIYTVIAVLALGICFDNTNHVTNGNLVWILLLIGAILIPLAIFIFGEMIPKMLGGIGQTRILYTLRWLVWVTYIFFYPCILLSEKISRSIGNIFGISRTKKSIRHEVDENTTLIVETDETEEIKEEEKEMLSSVIDLSNTIAKQIMVPRPDMKCLAFNTDFDEALALILETGHSRIPIYEENIDHIKGMIHAKDMLRYSFARNDDFMLSSILREVLFVPETKEVNELISEFRRNNIQIAIVTDEYGGTAGLITLEDLLEEIVGEINDEYDNKKDDIEQFGENEFFFLGNKRINEINNEHDLNLPESEDYNSIGGLILNYLEDLPEKGYSLTLNNNITLIVEEVSEGKIDKIRIIKK